MHHPQPAVLPRQRQRGQPVQHAIGQRPAQGIGQSGKAGGGGGGVNARGQPITDQGFGPACRDPAFSIAGGVGQKIKQHTFMIAHQADVAGGGRVAPCTQGVQHGGRIGSAINHIAYADNPGGGGLGLVCNQRQHRCQQIRHAMQIADDAQRRLGMGQRRHRPPRLSWAKTKHGAQRQHVAVT